MQLIWIPGSTSNVKKITISKRGLIQFGCLASLACILIGVGVHFLGFRIAIQYSPELARGMGGVITVQEKEAIESSYRQHLQELRSELSHLSERITEIKTLKDRFASLATPSVLRNKAFEDKGKGGPYQPILLDPQSKNTLANDLESTLKSTLYLREGIQNLEKTWQAHYEWLNQLPTGSPIANRVGLSSNFGTRIDPFTRQLAQHPGIDFSAPPGTPILASGDGKVVRAEFDNAYGNFIEIEHADNFVSKYAHARKLNVKAGQEVKRGQVIAEVGSTGRSTGPHLHYEISRNGSIINPMQILVAKDVLVAQQAQ
jgi:murein DD-endopeptidase MepM/ murein hydrolase activator NlpD